jgi:hypothetical protein
MPHPWLNLHKSTAVINYFVSNMTNTVIVVTLCALRNSHTAAVPFSPLHMWWRNQRNLSTYIESSSYCVSNNIFKYFRFREVIHNNYTLYYFVYMYTQICDENALIWGFPRQMFRPPSTWNCDDVHNQFDIKSVLCH